MSNLTLILTATALCFLCGAMASYSLIAMELTGFRLICASIVGVGCAPLGVFMGYCAYQESKLKT